MRRLLGTDGQKYFVLRERKGLITDGFFALSRNCNFLGDFMVYASFNVIAQSKLVWGVYLFIWTTVCVGRILAKDYSLSKKEGWEQYSQKTWILFPKFFDNTLLSLLVYATAILTGTLTYSNGGIQTTLK